MKNKNGFTLIELLSVIVLIGVILSLAVLGVSSLRKKILEKQYINVKTEIELAAEKYYNDTESMQMYVQTLLDEGYLKADNESKEIVDPRDSQNKLNCYIVDIKDEKGKLDDTGTYEKDCNQKLNNTYAIKIKMKLKENGEIEEIGDKWYNDSFILIADTGETINNYIWTTEQNPNAIGTENTYDLNILVNERGGVIEDKFYVSGINESGKELKSAAQIIKIDKVTPTIIKNSNDEEVTITNKDDWAKEKTISVELLDEGSGIKSYSFDTKENCENEDSWITLDKEKNKLTVSKVVNEEGTYYFCAKDGAGNKKTSEVIEVKNVDGVPPKCSYINEPEENDWTKNDRTISFGCEDNGSGCKYIEYDGDKIECNNDNDEKCLKEYEFKNSAKTEKIANTIGTFTIYDQVGNKTVCPVKEKTNLNIYLDNTYPNIEITNVSYDNNYLNVTINLTDSHSGPKEACLSLNNNSDSCNWVDCSNGKCALKLYTTISARKYYIYGKDNAGNIATKNVDVKKISSSSSGTRYYSGSFTENLNINGKVLDYSYTPITGFVTCYNTGKCTVTPETSSYKCPLTEKAYTSNPNYSCNKSDHYVDSYGYCRVENLYPEFENNTGYCEFSNGNYIRISGFEGDYGCKGWFDSYYEDVSVYYYCNNCSNNLGTFTDFPSLCRAMSNVSNFGNYTGYKGVTAHKKCRFKKYEATANCSYGKVLKNGTCYSCRRGYLDGYSCVYEGTCYKYEYSYDYTYYVY